MKYSRKIFALCLTISIAMLVAGFLAPPMGEISPSVLTAVGELFGFAALAVIPAAIKEGVNAKLTHGSTVIELTHDDDPGDGDGFPADYGDGMRDGEEPRHAGKEEDTI